MIRIAYVDDNMSESENIKNMIKHFVDSPKFGVGWGKNTLIDFFTDTMDFLSNYKYCYDLIFIDPQVNSGNGYRIIDELRKIDPDVILVFVSKTDEFALYGYIVDAVGYILKSDNEAAVNSCMERALRKVLSNNRAFINLGRDGVVVKVPVSNILYIEKFEHTLIYYTEFGEFKKKMSLKDVEEQFEELGFIKCNRGMMVNSHFIQSFNRRGVCLGKEILPISRGQYEEFAAKWQKRFEIQVQI